MDIILASASPRRQELLKLIVKDFSVVVSHTDEENTGHLPPEQYCAKTARDKAQSVWRKYPKKLVIGADTIVVLQGEILGKPKSEQNAREILQKLSGQVHEVITAVSICSPNGEQSFVSKTEVEFAPMTSKEIDDYIATGDAMDKAGAYGIQGIAARYIKGIKGDYFTVMGLPVHLLYTHLPPMNGQG